MKQPLELKALGIDREISSLRLWAFRIFAIVALLNVFANVATYTTAGIIGALIGASVVLVAILYTISTEKDETLGVRNTA